MMVERGRETGKHLEARKLIEKLVTLLCLSYSQINKADVVAGIQVTTKDEDGNPQLKAATETILTDVRNARAYKHIMPIYENLKRLIEKHHITDGIIQTEFENLTQALHPYKRTNLSLEYIKARIINAKKRVYIFNAFIPELSEFAHLLSKPNYVKLVMMSPTSRFLQQRAEELKKLGQTVPIFHNAIKNNVTALDTAHIEKSKYRFYTGLPTTPFYIFDDDIYCGFFLHDLLAADSPQRHFDAKTPEGKTLIKEFERIWTDSEKPSKSIFLEPPRPKEIQAFTDLFPGFSKKIIRKRFERIGGEMRGVYRFARYRSSYRKKQAKPIVTGLLQIFPYDELSGTIKFEARLPNAKKNNTKGMHTFSGVMMPYHDFVFMLGDTNGRHHPIIIGLQRFKNNDPDIFKSSSPPEGLVLRRHPLGHLLSARFILKPLGYDTIEHALKNFDPDGIYMDEEGFSENEEQLVKILRKNLECNNESVNVIKLLPHKSRE